MKKTGTGRTQERVLSTVNLYLPLYGATFAPEEILGETGDWEVPEETKKGPFYKMQVVNFFSHMVEDESLPFPFNPVEQQPVRTGMVLSEGTEDWAEISEEEFETRVKGFLNRALIDYAIKYIDLALETLRGIRDGDLADVDHVMVCYLVMIGNEGDKVPRSRRIEARYSVFAAQGLIEVEEE